MSHISHLFGRGLGLDQFDTLIRQKGAAGVALSGMVQQQRGVQANTASQLLSNRSQNLNLDTQLALQPLKLKQAQFNFDQQREAARRQQTAEARLQAAERRRQELFGILSPQLGELFGSVNFGETDNANGSSGFQNSLNFRQDDIQGILDQLKELSQGPFSGQRGVLADVGRQGIQSAFNDSLRDLRNLQAGQGNAVTAAAQRSDLLRSRLQAEKDLQQGLIISDVGQRQQTLGSMGNIAGADIQRRLSAQAQFGQQNLSRQQLTLQDLLSRRNLGIDLAGSLGAL